MRLNPQSSIVTQPCPELQLAIGHYLSFLISICTKPWKSLQLSFQRWSWWWPASSVILFSYPRAKPHSLASSVEWTDALRSLSVSKNIICNTAYSVKNQGTWLNELAWQASHCLSEKNYIYMLSPNGRNFSWKGKMWQFNHQSLKS